MRKPKKNSKTQHTTQQYLGRKPKQLKRHDPATETRSTREFRIVIKRENKQRSITDNQ